MKQFATSFMAAVLALTAPALPQTIPARPVTCTNAESFPNISPGHIILKQVDVKNGFAIITGNNPGGDPLSPDGGDIRVAYKDGEISFTTYFANGSQRAGYWLRVEANQLRGRAYVYYRPQNSLSDAMWRCDQPTTVSLVK